MRRIEAFGRETDDEEEEEAAYSRSQVAVEEALSVGVVLVTLERCYEQPRHGLKVLWEAAKLGA
jgi:hypothetical protein